MSQYWHLTGTKLAGTEHLVGTRSQATCSSGAPTNAHEILSCLVAPGSQEHREHVRAATSRNVLQYTFADVLVILANTQTTNQISQITQIIQSCT